VRAPFLAHAVSYGARYSFGIFVQPLTVENGWSRTVISMAASPHMLFFAAGGDLRRKTPGPHCAALDCHSGAAVAPWDSILSAFVDSPCLLSSLRSSQRPGSSWTAIVVGTPPLASGLCAKGLA